MAVVKRGKRFGAVVYEGGRHRWVGTFEREREAREAEAKALLERKTDGAVTVGEFAATWLETHPRPKRSTEVHYEQAIRGFVREFGHLRLSDLTRTQMRKWAVDHTAQAGTARAFLGDAVRDGLLLANPLAGMRLPSSRGRRDISALTEKDVQRLAEAAVSVHGAYGEHIYAPMILLAAYTGLRPGELHGLRWSDVRGEDLRVERQYSPKAQAFTSPKNGQTRTVPLLPPALKAIKAISRGTSEELFTTKQGKHFSGRVSFYYWSPVRAAFGDPSLDFYALRHAAGSFFARLGLGAPEIARILGHRDGGKLALERYIHVGEREALDRARQLYAMPRLRAVGE